MCGIAGIFHKNGEPVNPEILKRMADSMFLRGPDGEGFFYQDGFGLAHRRLSILDLAGGAQPLYNEDRTIVFVHNGEIYNHHELRKQLESAGHVFRTHSDSECIGHLYEEYGLDFPSHLEGMFAVALADLRNHRVVLATDHIGKKPVFYFENKGQLVFASTLPALAEHPDMPHKINLQGVWDYMSLLYIPMPDTVYEGVHKIPPGCLMAFDANREEPVIKRWWQPDFSRKSALSFEESAAKIRELVTQAVEKRLEADVPLGVFLSGGLDSAIVSSIAAKVPSAEPLRCFSIGFDSAAYDESALARAHADFMTPFAKRKVEFHHKIVRPDDFSTLEFLCSAYGEPFADASVLPTHLLCKFAREQVTVALSGDGADELFGGYERYRALNLLSRLNRIPLPLRKMLYAGTSCAGRAAGERSFAGRLTRFLKTAAVPADAQYPVMISKCADSLKRTLMGDAFADFNPLPAIRFWKDFLKTATAAGRTESAMEFDFAMYLPNDILTKADTASMNASLEVRSPFLDRVLMNEAAAMPLSYKLLGSQRKRILCEAFKDMLPPDMAARKKRGFGVPVAEWLRGPWKTHLENNLLEGQAAGKYGLFRRDAAENMIRLHCTGKADYSYQLYLLLVLELSLHHAS